MLNRRMMLPFLLFVLLCCATVFGQGTSSATLSGTVTDQQGAVVPGVTVTVKNVDTGQERKASTDSNGYYRVVDLSPGHYVVICNLPGHYAAGMHTDLTVR